MHWIDPPPHLPPISSLDLHPLVMQTLLQRGYSSPRAIQAFLDPSLYLPSPPSAIPGLASAADQVQAAVHAGKTICVWGDFDVDGQTSTTILVSALSELGAKVIYHIPVRAKESHGVNIPLLKEVIGQGAALVLTCDTGISSHAALRYARDQGVEVVITDHHDLPETLPEASAISNPKMLPADHPLATLSGAGVAYELAAELYGRFNRSEQAFQLLDLTALGLVADLALLKGEARYLVQKGLQSLRTTRRLGLQVMMEMAELKSDQLTEEHIGFALGPRLNALGRLGDANPAVDLLTTSDPERARLIAAQLEGLNAQRQLLTAQVTSAAEAQLQSDPSLLEQPVLVLSAPAWPGGVVGIAASRLVERYGRPTILLCTPSDGPAHGSARSVEGINITAAIAAQKDLLLAYGGHPMAAGLSLPGDHLAEFRKRLEATVRKMTGGKTLEPSLQIDAWMDLKNADLVLAEALERLAPFGAGNEKLVLASRDLTIQSAAPIGRNREHLRLTVADRSGTVQTVLWWSGAGEELPEGPFDLAYSLRASDWRGTRSAQLEFIACRAIETAPVPLVHPELEILDQRQAADGMELLKALPEGTQIWAEGEDQEAVGGRSRMLLAPSQALLIWTAPPSNAVLRQALTRVQPKRVILRGVSPSTDDPQKFLERLTGLVKFVLNRHQGKCSLIELAAVSAQLEIAVHLGLEWLAAKGQIVLEIDGEELNLIRSPRAANPYAVPELESGIRTVLEETHAYRLHFQRASKESLILPHAKG